MPEKTRTGGVDSPLGYTNGEVVGRRCAPRGERRSRTPSRLTRGGSLYTAPRRARAAVMELSASIVSIIRLGSVQSIFDLIWFSALSNAGSGRKSDEKGQYSRKPARPFRKIKTSTRCVKGTPTLGIPTMLGQTTSDQSPWKCIGGIFSLLAFTGKYFDARGILDLLSVLLLLPSLEG